MSYPSKKPWERKKFDFKKNYRKPEELALKMFSSRDLFFLGFENILIVLKIFLMRTLSKTIYVYI